MNGDLHRADVLAQSGSRPIRIDGHDAVQISIFETFEDAKPVWEQVEENGECYAFQTYRWLSRWHAAIGAQDGIRLCIVLVEDLDGDPLFILPLGIQSRWLGACLLWLGGALTDYRGPLLGPHYHERVDAEFFVAIWEAIQRELPAFDYIFLEQQPAQIGACDNPFTTTLACEAHPSDAHYTFMGGTLQGFLESKRSKRWLSTERRKERRLAEYGAARFVVAQSVEEIRELLPVTLEQKSRRYRELGVHDLFIEPSYVRFVQEMTEEHAREFFVFLCALTMGDRVLASFWGLVFRGRLYYLLPTYARDELTRYSPGNVLLRHMFEWCLENKVEVFDFTVGDEPYKALWCDQELALYDHFDGATLKGKLGVRLVRTQRRIKRKIKNTPWLWERLQALRSRSAK